MSDKQTPLQLVESLPDTANWHEITAALLGVVARRGSAADFVSLYRGQFTAEQLAEYLNPRPEYSLAAVIAELEARPEPGTQ
jgi:hypothetical protein